MPRETKSERWTRREFLSALAKSSATAVVFPPTTPSFTRTEKKSPSSRRRRVAILATEVRRMSHAQHFIDRFLEGYGWQGRHHRPAMELAALYVDQFPESDLSRDRSRRHGVRIYPTIAEALTLGRPKLAVDGVLIIGEHGAYPKNEKAQTLYPRHKFFQETISVFKQSGRAVPVFNDKHLSTNWDECVAMVRASKELGFPFLAGSSLPVTWRIPSIELPLNMPLAESVCASYGGIDSYDFHGLETAQCMSERRAGGEAGVRSIHAVRGRKVWDMLEGRETTRELLIAALTRSHTCRGTQGYSYSVPNLSWLRRNSKSPVAYFIDHLDGFKTTLFILNELIQDFNYAGLDRRTGEIVSCQMYLPMPPIHTTLADFFNPLVNNIEQMILEDAAPYPAERTLLTSGMVIFAVESLYRGQVQVETPELRVAYTAPAQSSYWRA
jgi:hypothetical protein